MGERDGPQPCLLDPLCLMMCSREGGSQSVRSGSFVSKKDGTAFKGPRGNQDGTHYIVLRCTEFPGKSRRHNTEAMSCLIVGTDGKPAKVPVHRAGLNGSLRISHHGEGINSEGECEIGSSSFVGFVVCFDRQVVSVDRGERLMMWPNLAPALPRSLLQHT